MKNKLIVVKIKIRAFFRYRIKLSLAQITLAPIFLMILLKRKKKLPQLLVFGLGEEQIFTGKNKTDLSEFFKEKRFNLNLDLDEILVELSKLRLNKQISNVIITPNISIYLLIYNFKKNISLDLLRQIKNEKSLNLLTIRSVKNYIVSLKKLIETVVWEYIANSKLETKIALTNSVVASLPIPIIINKARISTFLFWYSTNDQKFIKIGEEKKEIQKFDHLN